MRKACGQYPKAQAKYNFKFMFGREYSNYPEILLSSFRQMNSKYKKIGKKSNNNLLQKIYIYLFGIPEIGFQIRSMYFNSIIEKKLGRKNLKNILDAGSGIGTYAFWLSKKYPKAKVTGGEVDAEKIEFSKRFAKERKIENTEFKKMDITKLTGKKDGFDLIVNIDVLEHIDDYKKVIANFKKILSPRGYLFIHTPQPNQKRIFKSTRNWSHEDHKHEGYEPSELRKTLEDNGFKVLVMKETFGYFGKLAWELNHMSFKKGFIVAGLLYPITYVVSKADLLVNNKGGLGTALLVQKKN